MSVVPMQKVRVVVHQSDVDGFLTIVQRGGAMEFSETTAEQTVLPTMEFPHAQLFPRVQHAVAFLELYTPQIGLWTKLRKGTQSRFSESDILKKIQDTDVVTAVVEDLEKIQVELAEKTDRVRVLEEQHELLEMWSNLPMKLEHLQTTTTTTKLVSTDVPKTNLEEKLREVLTEANVLFSITKVSASQLAVTVSKETNLHQLTKWVESVDGVVHVTPEGTETPEVEFVKVSEMLAKAKGDVALMHDQAEHFAITHLKTLHVASEVLVWERDRYAAVDSAVATQQTVVFDGWLNADKRADVETALQQKNVAAVISVVALGADEQPPVDIKNSTFIQPFEVVTRLYGMPGYKDLDPTVFLAGFFFLFFGLSLTDVGYGVFLMAVSAIILTLFKVAPVVRTFAKLLLFMGLSSALVGLLFGGYLGIDPESLPAALRAIQVFDPIGNPLPVFYLALGLGVFQVMVGMVLKIYSDARNGQLMNGVLDQGPWLAMFFLAIAYLATVTGYLEVLLPAQLINLKNVGVVVIVIASGRKGETLLQKAQSAALSLYDSIGYFSDILSYSRLLALGLATTALAFAVNLIAELVSGSVPYLGPVLAVVVLVVGHLFTLAVNTLGAFIHSARLQFVEFFGKFIAGTGKEFKPLHRTERYITVTDE
jgi:V/A-type H+-transporting ATPase subunit I